jgi:putative transposase
MTFDPDRHHRRSIRLAGFDYAAGGAYFVTICVRDRQCLFGEVIADGAQLNACGRCIVDAWQGLGARFASVALDEFVVMPNHVHGVIFLDRSKQEAGAASSAPTKSIVDPGAANVASKIAATLGDVIRAFKSISAIAVNRIRSTNGQPLWQRNYFERVIRDADELARIRQYIADNPANWNIDDENPQRPSPHP